MMRLTYRYGNEHSPTFRTGRHRLDIVDKEMSLVQVTSTESRKWSGSVDDVTVNRIGELLRAAGFPDAPTLRPPADSPMRHLRVADAASGRDDTMMLPWYEAMEVSGYAELFGFLDTLVETIAAGPPAQDGPPSEAEQTVVPPRMDSVIYLDRPKQ
jgi:hypothetical protein